MGNGAGSARTPEGTTHRGPGYGRGWPHQTSHSRQAHQFRQNDGDGGQENTLGDVKEMGELIMEKIYGAPEFSGRRMDDGMYGTKWDQPRPSR